MKKLLLIILITFSLSSFGQTLLVIASSTNETCGQSNGTATATPSGGSGGGYTYLWNTSLFPQTTQTALNLPAGTYTVTVSCGTETATATVTINNTPGPAVTISGISSASCGMQNGSASLMVVGGTPPYSYGWNSNPPQFTQNLANVPAGAYYVSVTDANGCMATTSVAIAQTPGPNVTVNSTNETCGMSNGTATAIANGGSGYYTYLWSDGQATCCASGLSEGSYTVTVSDGYCLGSATVNILEIPGPIAAFTLVPDTAIQHHYYVINNVSGIPPLSYLWSWGDGTSDTIAYPTHIYSTAGNYTICLSITDSTGTACTGTYCDSSYLQKSTNTIISVDVIPSETTGLNVNELSDLIKIYPNPVSNIFTLETSQKSTLEIFNIQGQLIKILALDSYKTKIDVSTFPVGVYIVEVKTEKGMFVEKFVKQ